MRAASIALAMMMIVLSGCAGQNPPPALQAVWEDGETGELAVYRAGEQIGEWTHRAERSGDGWWLTSSQRSGETAEESVVLTGADLVPVRTEFSTLTPSGEATYVAVYGERDVAIDASLPQGPQSASVRLPRRPFYDNEQFTMIVRTLPLTDGYTGTVNIVVSRTASKAQLRLKVTGRERIETPAGTFDTYKVELLGLRQFAWVAIDPPHQVVRYDNEGAGTTSLLIEYRGK